MMMCPRVARRQARSMVACDVCVNNLLPLANTKLLRDYSRVDPRVAQLVGEQPLVPQELKSVEQLERH